MQGLMLAAQSLVSPGDRVVTLVPGWPNIAAIKLLMTDWVCRGVPLELFGECYYRLGTLDTIDFINLLQNDI